MRTVESVGAVDTIGATRDTELEVDGMTCGSCVRHVEGALRTLRGVTKVTVELRDGLVRVEHDPSRSSIEQIIHALGAAGYPARAS